MNMDIDVSEHLPDANDVASRQELLDTSASVAHISRLAQEPEKHPDFDEVHCVDCGDEIPAARLAAGRVRCTGCQSLIEIRSKQYGR